MIGERLGPYRVLRELGHGGMGAVYLAARADDQYQKEVAIKLVRAGLDSPDLIARFRRERQILAQLEHPGIARLLDAGMNDTGVPYVVMEFVDGEPIGTYCDRHRLSTMQRVKLFRQVCGAVEYAHQNLVVHRDVKPGNILVNADGVPKLLDFGIAKLLAPGAADQTRTEFRPFTPEYASPEQVRGEPVTTATDVYSLGVLLYELLTGQQPHRITSNRAAEIERAICEEEPEKPGAVKTQLRGELEDIILMAMRKEPSRRYASAHELSEDLRRHLDGYPVRAQPDTWRYRAGKFVRRNRLAVGAAGLLAALLVGFSAAMAVLTDRLAQERDTAQQVSGFLVDTFKVSDPNESRGNAITAREVLDRGAVRIARELNSQPDVKARLMDTIGRVYQGLGLHDRALPLLEEALQLRNALHGERHLDVAETRSNLAWSVEMKGRNKDAEKLYRDALAVFRDRFGDDHVTVAKSKGDLAGLLRVMGRYKESESLYREALAVRRRRLPAEHVNIAENLHDLAQTLHDQADYTAAEPLFRQALEMRIKLLGEDHPEVADNLNNIALLLYHQGRYAEAEPVYRRSLALRRKVMGEEHLDVGNSLNNLALLFSTQGRLDEAEPLYREAIALRRKVLGADHQLLGNTIKNLADLLSDKHDYVEAESLYRQSLAIFRKRSGERNLFVASALYGLGMMFLERGDVASAETNHTQALEIRRALFGAEHPRYADSLTGLGLVFAARGDRAAAEPQLRKAVEILRKTQRAGHPGLASPLLALGSLLTETGRAAEAEPLLREALEIRRQSRREGHPAITVAEKALRACQAAMVSSTRTQASPPP